ncbi:alpha-N-arabinofuranosidase [Candidatus Aerophobetes bacterium]|uniref:non-reducing end alpha-L-arabinofuranosidase n=1 Tax=Aerophobetes bacterium TaxID=2030807 RepID=A0A497E4R6_UNCAE|nr:MAG: alpha-N-arabinofuranosidase [Candidatus Aerophobetes bacterium]
MSQSYRIKVDAERVMGKIDSNIYGHFIEHLGRCIYGGIYEEGSPLSDERGFRKDVLEAVRRIKCPILRWPGGNFASNYHWEDGIGPKEKRPVRFDLAWGKEETNRFGTDEFIEYCRKVGAEPYICINLGTGSLDEAIHWLEYCNSSGNTYYARLREKNGHAQPYRVKYWGIGNEIYGEWQVGHRSAKEYAKVLREYARFMKVVDPSIKVIAVGADDPEWDLEVIKTAGKYIDYISNHQYWGSDDYYETVASAYWIEKRLKLLKSVIEVAQPSIEEKKRVKIALDEWNIWYRGTPENSLEENYALKDALFAAGVFIILHRLCRSVTMANLAQLVNVIGAIHTDKQGLYLTPIYRVFELFVNHTGEVALDALVNSETYDIEGKGFLARRKFKLKGVPYLDASVTLSKDKDKLFIAAVNFHRQEDIECSIILEGFSPGKEARIYELNGPDVMAVNDFDNPERVKITGKTIKNASREFSYVFPAHSATVIELIL